MHLTWLTSKSQLLALGLSAVRTAVVVVNVTQGQCNEMNAQVFSCVLFHLGTKDEDPKFN